MPIRVLWMGEAKKDLSKLDSHLATRIIETMKKREEAGTIQLEKVETKNYFRARVGDYRLLGDYFSDQELFTINTIYHRKNAYKNLK